MGSYWGWNNRRKLIEELTKTQEGGDYKRETIARACVGNNLWSVIEVTRQLGPGVRHIERHILLDKLMCNTSGRGSDKTTTWGHKPLSEDMHPYTYSCPLKFLNMVPSKNWEWRLKVMGYWAAREYRRKYYKEIKTKGGIN